MPACGADDAYLVAFDAKSGKERWRAFDDRGNYSAPIVIDQAGRRVLVCWSGDRVLGADPAQRTQPAPSQPDPVDLSGVGASQGQSVGIEARQRSQFADELELQHATPCLLGGRQRRRQ